MTYHSKIKITFDFIVKRNKTKNRRGPRIEPWGTPYSEKLISQKCFKVVYDTIELFTEAETFKLGLFHIRVKSYGLLKSGEIENWVLAVKFSFKLQLNLIKFKDLLQDTWLIMT